MQWFKNSCSTTHLKWFLTCVCKLSFRLNFLWQCKHSNGLSPVCTRTCLANFARLRNVISQWGHWEGNFFFVTAVMFIAEVFFAEVLFAKVLNVEVFFAKVFFAEVLFAEVLFGEVFFGEVPFAIVVCVWMWICNLSLLANRSLQKLQENCISL